jgi:hypothetical protein
LQRRFRSTGSDRRVVFLAETAVVVDGSSCGLRSNSAMMPEPNKDLNRLLPKLDITLQSNARALCQHPERGGGAGNDLAVGTDQGIDEP